MRLPFLGRRIAPADLPPVLLPAAPKPGPVVVSAALTLPPAPVVAAPGPRFQSGRYVVTYHRFGQHGDRRSGRPAPATLTLVADSVADLAEQVRRDIEPFVGGGARIEVTVDMVVSGGKITAGPVTGTFTFARGGAR
jgi:hypothetical protein